MPVIRRILICLCLIGCIGALAWADQPQTFHLTLLHTNDFHGADYAAMAREATLIKRIRTEEPHVLYVDAGDTFARGPYHYKFYGALEFAVLNAEGCDALTLGNNEFKASGNAAKAQDYLSARIDQAEFPILCANIKSEKDGTYLPKVHPYVVKSLDGLRIGIIGVTTDEIANYPQIDGLVVEEPLKTVASLFPKVSSECDGVLALTHIGYGMDCKLAVRAPKLWAIVGGHSHTRLDAPEIVNRIPVVQAGDQGHYLGRLDLFLEKQGDAWVVKSFKGSLIPVNKDIPEDPAINAIIQQFMSSLKEKAS